MMRVLREAEKKNRWTHLGPHDSEKTKGIFWETTDHRDWQTTEQRTQLEGKKREKNPHSKTRRREEDEKKNRRKKKATSELPGEPVSSDWRQCEVHVSAKAGTRAYASNSAVGDSSSEGGGASRNSWVQKTNPPKKSK